MNIEEAAEKYAITVKALVLDYDYNSLSIGFVDGALSDAAKQYWFKQFKAEQVMVENEAAEKYFITQNQTV